MRVKVDGRIGVLSTFTKTVRSIAPYQGGFNFRRNLPLPNPPLAKGRESQPVQRFHETPTRLALEKGGNRIGSPPFEGGFRGIKLGLEATPPTLKYARFQGDIFYI